MTNLATIITQGDELTRGSILNTNAQWLSNRLTKHGWKIRSIITVPDDPKELVRHLKSAQKYSNIVVSSGGLGSTVDDHTRTAFSQAFDCELYLDEAAKEHLKSYCLKRKKSFDSRSVMAQIPKGALLIPNPVGSAVGFQKDISGCVFYFLPGVPEELKKMFSETVIPDLTKGPSDLQKSYLCVGVSEVDLQNRLAFIDMPNSIGLRASRTGNIVNIYGPELTQNTVERIRIQLQDCCAAENEDDLSKVIAAELNKSGETIAVAESCTAGRVASWIASVPGSSAYFLEGVVVYSNAAKQKYTGVTNETLEKRGAVSKDTACQLALGIRRKSKSNWGISVTGIAGPGGGTPEKPVGTVHIAVSGPNNILEHRKLSLHGSRDQITQSSATYLLFLLYQTIQKNKQVENSPPVSD